MAREAAVWERWRQQRLRSANRLRGDATLVSTTWLTPRPTAIDGGSGDWFLGAGDAVHHVPAADALGYAFEPPVTAAGPVELPHEFVGILGETAVTPVHWAGIGTAVRVWNAERGDVERIDAFDHDERWVLDARFIGEAGTVGYEYLGHGGRSEQRRTIGELVVHIEETEYRLAVTAGQRGAEVVVADPTNGTETYGRGRFVPVAVGDDGAATIDLNFAFLPPCAFSDAFDCPLAPPQNRIRTPIRAGERSIVRSPLATRAGEDGG